METFFTLVSITCCLLLLGLYIRETNRTAELTTICSYVQEVGEALAREVGGLRRAIAQHKLSHSGQGSMRGRDMDIYTTLAYWEKNSVINDFLDDGTDRLHDSGSDAGSVAECCAGSECSSGAGDCQTSDQATP